MSTTKIVCACTNEFASAATQEDADNGEACCETCAVEIAAENEALATVKPLRIKGTKRGCMRCWRKAKIVCDCTKGTN